MRCKAALGKLRGIAEKHPKMSILYKPGSAGFITTRRGRTNVLLMSTQVLPGDSGSCAKHLKALVSAPSKPEHTLSSADLQYRNHEDDCLVMQA